MQEINKLETQELLEIYNIILEYLKKLEEQKLKEGT